MMRRKRRMMIGMAILLCSQMILGEIQTVWAAEECAEILDQTMTDLTEKDTGESDSDGEDSDAEDSDAEDSDTADSDAEDSDIADPQPPEKEPDKQKIYLGIDTVHTYENMNHPFSQGYVPVIDGDLVHLTLPFTASGELKNQSLMVELDLGSDAPFVYANYQKKVEKMIYTFGEEQTETYLYQCDINLEQERQNGKYPVTVKATGYTENGRKITMDSRIYVTISDGKDPSAEPPLGEENPSEEEPPSKEESPGEELPEPEGGTGDVSFGGEMTEEVMHQPKMILESNGLAGERIQAGTEKDFIFSFKNRSRKEKIYNLKITVKPAEDTAVLKKTSFYYDTVAPQEVIALATTVTISPVAQQKSIPVDFIFEYENSKGNSYTGTEQAVISVYQPVEAAVEGFQLPGQVYSLENIFASMQIRNMGKAPIYNVQVWLEGTGLFSVQTVFAGNMEAGQTVDGDMKIYVGNKNMKTAGKEENGSEKEKYGPVTGKLILTYEDEYGEAYRQETEISTVISKPKMTELKVENIKTESSQWWAVSFVLLCLISAGIIGGMGWRIRKNKHQLADFLAERERMRER